MNDRPARGMGLDGAERAVLAVAAAANVGQRVLPFGARFASNLGAALEASVLALVEAMQTEDATT